MRAKTVVLAPPHFLLATAKRVLSMIGLCTALMHCGIGYDRNSMHVEPVQVAATPTRVGLVRDFMKIECRHCTAAYHLYHDGVGLKVLRDYFLQASREISRQHPDHGRVIPLAEDSVAAHKQAS